MLSRWIQTGGCCASFSESALLKRQAPKSVFLRTRTGGTRLQITFLQVSRVRRGATQRDYRLLYYKFCRFVVRKIWHSRIWNDRYCVPQLYKLCEHFLRAARGLEDITVNIIYYIVHSKTYLRAACGLEYSVY